MAARTYARATDRIDRRRRPLTADRPGPEGHHRHRSAAQAACSCGEDLEEACYADPDDINGGWSSQKCSVCGQLGVVLEGNVPTA
jgi:hypothetical protein